MSTQESEVYTSYNNAWSELHNSLSEFLSRGEKDPSRALAYLTTTHTRQHKHPTAYENPSNPEIPFGQLRLYSPTGHEQSVCLALFRTKKQLLLKTLVDMTQLDGSIYVAELGSGIGINLFDLWLNGSSLISEYYGFEYTLAGRELASRLAVLAEGLDFTSLPLDFYSPALLSDFKPRNKSGVAFTCYSLEQIPLVSESMIYEFSRIPGLEIFMHLEPVGWQLKYLPSEYKNYFKKSPLGSSEALNIRASYNQNLLPILIKCHQDGIIELDFENSEIDCTAHRPGLPGSAIYWRPRRPSSI